MNADTQIPQDTLNARMGVLARREVEARLLAPLIGALAAEFGRERVVSIVRSVIIDLARNQGAALAQQMDGDSLSEFAGALSFWTREDALEIDLIEQSDEAFSFNVTRCRYAELYIALGIAELGAVLSCNRDFSLIEGFNSEIELTRTQTIMDGASYCDFRYRQRDVKSPENRAPTTV